MKTDNIDSINSINSKFDNFKAQYCFIAPIFIDYAFHKYISIYGIESLICSIWQSFKEFSYGVLIENDFNSILTKFSTCFEHSNIFYQVIILPDEF